MVHKINNKNKDINDYFIDLIQENIGNRRQSILFLNNSNTIVINSRQCSVELDGEALIVYVNEQ